jgi:tetratricopeptide (TPR) repeat protein
MRTALAAASGSAVSPFTQAAALGHAAIIAMLCRDVAKVQPLADELATFTARYELPHWGAIARGLGGWALVQHGEIDKGIEVLEEASAALAATGTRIFSTYILAFLSEAHFRRGTYAEGLAAAEQGLRVAETTLDRSYWPELWRLKGELLVASSAADSDGARGANRASAAPQRDEAETCLRRALEVARSAEAKSLELRAAVSLARTWQARGRAAEARELLGGVCEWFGAVTSPDLLEARSLVAQLSAPPPTAPRAPRRGRRY